MYNTEIWSVNLGFFICSVYWSIIKHISVSHTDRIAPWSPEIMCRKFTRVLADSFPYFLMCKDRDFLDLLDLTRVFPRAFENWVVVVFGNLLACFVRPWFASLEHVGRIVVWHPDVPFYFVYMDLQHRRIIIERLMPYCFPIRSLRKVRHRA